MTSSFLVAEVLLAAKLHPTTTFFDYRSIAEEDGLGEVVSQQVLYNRFVAIGKSSKLSYFCGLYGSA